MSEYKKELEKTKEEASTFFLNLKNRQDIAELLEVKFSQLVYLLYHENRPQNYKKFSLKKKSGGLRTIDAPITSLKILQKKLSNILYSIHKPRISSYGFCKNKDIVGNAQLHTNKKWVFNIDLENFFPSIHIGRVIGLFMATPFNFPKKVATTLAQIMCHEAKLPQGAPTSPIISNMICSGLDKELQKLAKKNFCIYSRYCDDITFSSTKRTYPRDILYINKEGTIIPGIKLNKIIEKHTFKINNKKTRVNNSYQRQSVTGLTSNLFPNVPRQYIQNTRAMLHCWETKGEKVAQEIFQSKYFKFINHRPEKNKPNFKYVIAGKINFIRMVRGYKDPVFRILYNKLNLLSDNGKEKLPLDKARNLFNTIWIIKDELTGKHIGTAFNLKGFGLVTCHHVVAQKSGVVTVHKWDTPEETFEAYSIGGNEFLDISVLKIDSIDLSTKDELNLSDIDINIGQQITIFGCTNNYKGDTPQIYDAKISGAMDEDKPLQKRYSVDKNLYSGMSGSPAIDLDNNVIGIATHGAKSAKTGDIVYGHRIASISPIRDINLEL